MDYITSLKNFIFPVEQEEQCIENKEQIKDKNIDNDKEEIKGKKLYKLFGKDFIVYAYMYKYKIDFTNNGLYESEKYRIRWSSHHYDNLFRFCTEEQILDNISYDSYYIREVELPEDAEMDKIGLSAYVANKLMMCDKRVKIEEFFDWNDEEFCRKTLENSSKKVVPNTEHIFKFVKNKTDELCKLAVSIDGASMIYIDDPSEELKFMAFEKSPWIYNKIKNPPYELSKLAVALSDYNFKYIPKEHKTYELCNDALNENGMNLKYIDDQTDELCEIAVRNNGLAIQFVKCQNQKLCKLAYEQNKNSIKHIKKKFCVSFDT
uniref:DUF4116 domain-containing protein n=1 Tax=viral metagenome TaxID=1070528 RepID=A0A6C0EBD2_9ZZZZ